MARPEQRPRLRGDAGRGHGTEWDELIQAAQLCRKPEEVLGLSQLLGDSANDFSAAAQDPESKQEGSVGT